MALIFFIGCLVLLKLLMNKKAEVVKQKEITRMQQENYRQEREKMIQIGTVIHLYAALSEEEARTESLKEKQREIMKQAERLLE